ncbi:hypothetical protein [Anaerotignum sp. MB30-C6]|nr:hypothetical protein [Anaerotignum sp. MB30-C6]WMI80176.1 hypothetical protein RBQ60_10045 [Anaerotignum sp. MB30-C6]
MMMILENGIFMILTGIKVLMPVFNLDKKLKMPSFCFIQLGIHDR